MRGIRMYKRPGEDGYILPIALGFIVMTTLITSVVMSYISTGTRVSAGVQSQRANLSAVDGAVDTAIKYAQTDTTLGSIDDGTCQGNAGQFFNTVNTAGTPIKVTCTAASDSGGAGGITTAPSFAILTLAPYRGVATGGGTGSFPNCLSTNPSPPGELGVVQVQDSKLLQIYGDVYVNSDADGDTYRSDGCPNVTGTGSALPMVVYGNVVQRESNHDFCVGPTNLNDPKCDPYIHSGGPNGTGTAPYTDTAPLANPSAAQSALLADPGLPANDPNGMWQPNFTSPPAAGVITDTDGHAITTCPAADPNSGYRLITFSAGTYRDVNVLNSFTNGGCPNAVLWFSPGDYYFDFTNAGSGSTVHQWTINDTGVRIVGGQPFSGTSSYPMLFSNTWKPTVASGTGFTNPNSAMAIDGTSSTATLTSGTATLNLGTFKRAGTSIPADAQINSVRLRVAHGESNTTLLGTPTVTITPGTGGSACTAVAVTPRLGAAVEDPAPKYDIFNISGSPCLNDVSRINDSMSLKYTISHCAPVTGACTATSATDSVDGIWMDITYTTGGRLAWSPFDSSTISPSSPSVPGSCMSDRDSGAWTKGVQFVFGGDSHVQLKSGKVELCNKPSTTKQEISVYGVRSTGATSPIATTWQPVNATNGSSGFTNYVNGRVVDGSSATAALSSATTTRTMTDTQFSPSTWPIPAAGQIPANATNISVELDVTHSGTTGANSPTLAVSSGSTSCGTFTLANHTNLTATGADLVNLTSCLGTAALLNAGVSAQFTARRSSGSPTESLDGMQLKIGYTVPAPSTGSLSGETGCVTQTPYATPPVAGTPNLSHAPGYNGACALIQVATDSAGGSFPRTLAIWGTVYAPSAALDVPVDVMTVPVFNRGVVARTMMLGYNVANNAIVPITTTPNAGFVARNRHMTLRAQIGTTSVTADVKVCDNPDTDSGVAGCGAGDGSVRVLSWKATH